MQVEAGLVQMRETAYGKVLQCLPYPRELVSPASSTWQCTYAAQHLGSPGCMRQTCAFPAHTGSPRLAPHHPQMTCLLLSFHARLTGTGFLKQFQLLSPP